jgi:DNA-binding LacI/PurR family transcriptional regulator
MARDQPWTSRRWFALSSRTTLRSGEVVAARDKRGHVSSPNDVSRHPASIRDVARIAGVSRQTVSRVINSHPSLRPETRDRVQSVINQLGYRPNRVARALGGNRSHTIGVLAAQRTQYGPAAAIQGIESAAQEVGYVVNTTNLVGSAPEAIREALAQQVDQMVDGIVIVAPQTPVLDELNELELTIPYVLLHSRSADDPHELFVDQLAGTQAAMRHLLELDHRMIHHLAGPQEWMEAQARLHGFRKELTEAGIGPPDPVFGDWTAESGYQRGHELLTREQVTAVFVANDQMALGLMHALHDLGLDVPRDVSVVGFDDIPEAAHFYPPLTTVRQDFNELGRQCVARLINPSIQSVGTAAALPPTLVVRKTTARCPCL